MGKILLSSFLILILVSCSIGKVSPIEENFLLSDKGRAKYYLIKQIRKTQKENKLGENPMLIINGSVIYYSYKEDLKPIKINKLQIRTLKFTKAENCVKLYGKACRDGLITITASY